MPDHLLKVFSGHTSAVNAIRFTSDGNYCMTASDDKSLKLWNPFRNQDDNLNNPSVGIAVAPSSSSSSYSNLPAEFPKVYCVQTFSGVHGYSIADVAISNDKSKFASGGDDKSCFLWDVVQSRVLRRIQAHNLRTNSLCFNIDGTVLFTASYDKTVKCWDLRANQREPIQILSDFKDSVTFVRQSVNTSTILASSVDGTVRIYDLRQGYMHTDSLMGDPITCLNLSEDEKTYLATCLGGKIRMMEIATGKVLKEYSGGHQHSHFKIESSFENNYSSIVTGSENGSMIHYQVISGGISDKTENAHEKGISSISCHPSMELFATASYDGEAKLWNRQKS